MSRRVCINGRFLSQRRTGVQRYALETLFALDELVARDSAVHGWDFEVLAPPDAEQPALRRIAFRRVGRLRGNAWEQISLPLAARGAFLLSFGPTGPLLKRHQAVTIHDAAVHAVPQAFSFAFRTWYKLLLPVLVQRSPFVMTVSEFSKAEVVEHFAASAARTRVSGEGWQHLLRITPDPSILSRHGLTQGRYLLSVSSLTPHKNFGLVAEAARRLQNTDIQLVVAGGMDARVFGHIDLTTLNTLKCVGYVSDAELRALYENAAAFVFPSLYEGFGIPPLEAMASGCPVLAARAGAIPEVCGDAAWYFDPRDADELAKLLLAITQDETARQDLRERGLRRITQHSWEHAAREHLLALAGALETTSDAASQPNPLGRAA